MSISSDFLYQMYGIPFTPAETQTIKQAQLVHQLTVGQLSSTQPTSVLVSKALINTAYQCTGVIIFTADLVLQFLNGAAQRCDCFIEFLDRRQRDLSQCSLSTHASAVIRLSAIFHNCVRCYAKSQQETEGSRP